MLDKFPIQGMIRIFGNPRSLYYGLNPENKTTPKYLTVTCNIDQNTVLCSISGQMSIGRLKNTVDDILKTAILITTIKIGVDN